MTPERWRQVDQVFQAAIELKAEERAAFVESACANDEELRREVESLITADKQGLSFVDEPAFQVAAGLLAMPELQLAEGQSIGHYEIVGPIGRGGMGEVYLAKDKLLNRRIALKLLPVDYTRNKDRLRRFQQEAQAASALNHPNILTIYELGQVDGQQFIATEFVEGETLRQRMKRGRLSLSEALDITVQTAGALAAAHKAGIVHRDIKPENLMIRPDGYVKVLDFGLAKLTEQQEQTTKAQAAENVNISSGLVMGTVKYMSPEQARGLAVDARSDIFSFGVVLYEMLAGHAPFEGKNSNELISAILKKEPPTLTDAPEEVQRLISRALRKRKEDRYQTIEDFLVDLKRLNENKAFTVGAQTRAQKMGGSALSTGEAAAISTASTIEYVVSGIKRHKISAVFVVASLAVVVIGLSLGLTRLGSRLRASSNQIRIAPIPGTEMTRGVAISPDGKFIAQVKISSGKFAVWLIELATGTNTELASLDDIDEHSLTFSKDGGQIFYVSKGVLYQISTGGGEATKVLADVAGPISFAPDGKQVAFVRDRNFYEETALTVVNLEGSSERILATRKGKEFIDRPAWSPDGSLIACSFGLAGPNRTASLIGFEVATGQEKQITSRRWQGFEDVAWLPDGSGLVAAAKETFSGPGQIWHISYPEGAVRRITADLNNYGDLSLTADGKSLVAIQYTRQSSLWLVPKGDPNGAKPITSSEREVYRFVSWTPDRRILYPSDVGGNRDIWIMNIDGTNPKQLTANAGVNIQPEASPDGHYIVFSSNRANKGAFNIWRMDMDGSNPIQLTYGSGETGPVCSPDGRWVVYAKGGPEVENAQRTLWKVPINGGEPVQVTNLPSHGPAISPDGTLIACWYKQDASSQWTIALIPLAGGPPIQLMNAPHTTNYRLRWTPEGKAISYIDTREDASNIWSQPISGGPPKQVTQFTSEGIERFDWLGDGRLVCSRLHNSQDVVLISDFK